MGTIIIHRPDGMEMRKASAPPTNKELSEIVGGFPELVHVLYRGKRAQMFVNEDGHRLGLAPNIEATRIYHAASVNRANLPEGTILTGVPIIVGPAVVLDGADVQLD
jgi:hypothetical protein